MVITHFLWCIYIYIYTYVYIAYQKYLALVSPTTILLNIYTPQDKTINLSYPIEVSHVCEVLNARFAHFGSGVEVVCHTSRLWVRQFQVFNFSWKTLISFDLNFPWTSSCNCNVQQQREYSSKYRFNTFEASKRFERLQRTCVFSQSANRWTPRHWGETDKGTR